MSLKQRWYGAWIAVLVALVCVLMAPLAQARTVLDLDVTRQPVPLLDWGDEWLDATGKATPANVDANGVLAWQPTRQGAIYPLTTGQALWIRFTVPPAPDSERWYLEVPLSSVNRVSLYTRDNAGAWNEQRAGDTIAVSAWPVPHRHPLLPVIVSAEEPRRYLLRIENPTAFGVPLNFVSESHLSRSEQRTSLILGIYFGLAGLAVMISALSAVSLRDSAYALYAPTVALMALTQASITGIAGLHLWPDWPVWNDLAPVVLPALTAVPMMLFVSAVVSMPERSWRFHRTLQGLAVLGLLLALVTVLVDSSLRTRLVVPYLLVSQLAMVIAFLWAWRRGDRYAGWVTLGFLPVLLTAAWPIARAAGLAPSSFMTTYGMQLGIAFELPVLLVALMLRSQQRREHNRRIHGLDRMDPATGLINGHVFTERLVRMIARSTRLRHQGAMLLIDIVNVEQIQRDFDRRSAEELPLRVAGRLLSATREIDSVARLSELRFAMLLEGPLTPEEAVAAGPRVVARCLMPFKDKSPDWVAQLRVAQALVPLDGLDAATLLERLAGVLAGVPRESRRAVFSLSEKPESSSTAPAMTA
ncbi:MAG: diguanylate cyclase [Bdellovibrionales bacterium]|nr:diguanylate cyclase [Ramlibacter sp.]